MEKILNEVKTFLKTLICFLIACLLLPVLLLSFILVHYGNELLNYVLSIKYPTLTISKSKKIRTLIDTQRNSGIFHFLLQVKGPCDFKRIKQQYEEHLIEVQDKAGILRFPKLRQKLVKCWGHYAWVNDMSTFNINNHVLLSTHSYRGRPVSDANIEEFVSDVTTKYIPSDLPQWQVIVIPSAATSSTTDSDTEHLAISEEHYHILVKVHHLIIAEEEDLHVSEMLLLQSHERHAILDIDELKQPARLEQLSYFVRAPVHIQNLLRRVSKEIIQRWSKFIYTFDSLETHDGCERVKITTITQLLSVLLIIAVNVSIDYWRTLQSRKRQKRNAPYAKPNKDPYMSRWRIFRQLLTKEMTRRELNWQIACSAVQHTLQPSSLAKSWTKLIWQMNVNNVLLLPYHCYCEIMAMRDLLFRGQTSYSTSYSARLYVYVPLVIYAQIEFWKICYELYKAPLNIFEELFVHPSREANILQMKSYSGRKIISFSKSIDGAALRKRNQFDKNLRESDFSLTCLAGALHDYFESYASEAPVPRILNTTCRTVAKGYFTEHTGQKADYVGGVVFLQLPLKRPDLTHAQELHAIVEQIRHRQIMIYLASMGQTKYDLLTALLPRVVTKIFINFFSLNFPVTITEIHGTSAEFKSRWGQEVTDVLLFRPPQSKTCLSLNLHRFGDKYRLAVMADTMLGPDHAKITRAFENYMENVTL